MVSRSLLALFAVALIAVSANASSSDEVEIEYIEEFDRSLADWFKKAGQDAGKKIINEVLKYVKGKAGRINLDCVPEVLAKCDMNPLSHPKKYYKCAHDYIIANKAHCYPKNESVEPEE